MNGSQRLNLIIEKVGLDIPRMANSLGVTKELLYMIQKGSRNISKKLAISLYDVFGIPPEFSLGSTKELVVDVNKIEEAKKRAMSNSKPLGDFDSEHDDGETKFIPLTPGWWGMLVELVPEYAKAGYLSSYADPEYIESLPKHYFTVNVLARGKYRAFEITGDSMDNGRVGEAIPDGTIVLAREVGKHLWGSKLHNHKWPNWIFVHRYEGIICKQIAHQDLQTGDLTLRSLNPDRDTYPDIVVNIDDLEQIYNVIIRQLK